MKFQDEGCTDLHITIDDDEDREKIRGLIRQHIKMMGSFWKDATRNGKRRQIYMALHVYQFGRIPQGWRRRKVAT